MNVFNSHDALQIFVQQFAAIVGENQLNDGLTGWASLIGFHQRLLQAGARKYA